MNSHIESWCLYFSDEEYSHLNNNIAVIHDAKKWLQKNIGEEELGRIFCKATLEISSEVLRTLVPCGDVDNGLKCIACAASEVLFERGFDIIYITVRITTFGTSEPFSEIKVENIGRLIQITGTVCRIGPKRPLFSKLHFECVKCKEVIVLSIQNNVYRQPKRCKGSCKSKLFNVLTDSPDIRCRDFQEIKIQEMFYESKMPRMIEAVLYDDLVGCLAPGEVVHVLGIVRAESESRDLYKLIVHVNNVQLYKSRNLVHEDTMFSFGRISEISKTPNLLSSLIHSVFPEIFGNEIIKAGLVLAMFGGSEKFAGESKVRGEIHVLIIGDPGLGKSKMLLSVCAVLPKSTYVCGNFTTTAGLTIALTHDPVSGDFIAEAGALVLSDNGICCLDEFDKIENHKSLYEVMEQQRVTVAKGGVVCSVPTRATVVAATNPKFGHFKKDRGLRQNIKFDSALLSRFDLVFVLQDNLDEGHNLDISNYILNSNKGLASTQTSSDFILNRLRQDQFLESLRRREDTAIFGMDVLREYISYAKSSVSPILSKQARELLKSFYLSIRKTQDVTVRDLESLIRLCEAKAKTELRSIATKKDAEFVVELFKRSMFKETGREKRCRGGFKEFVEILKTKSREARQDVFTAKELGEFMSRAGIDKPKHEFIDALNSKGVLLKKGRDSYQLL